MEHRISKGLAKYSISKSEVDSSNCLTISSLLHLFNISAANHTKQAEIVAIGLREQNAFFALSQISILIEKLPVLDSEITIVTCFKSIDSSFLFRDFLVFDSTDTQNPIIKATSAWTLQSIESHRPQKIDLLTLPASIFEITTENDAQPTKVDALPCAWSHSSGVVTANDLDTNGFVSKSCYLDWISSVYSEDHTNEMIVKRVDINYKSDGVLGDTYKINMASKGGGVYLNNVVRDIDQKELVRTRIQWFKR